MARNTRLRVLAGATFFATLVVALPANAEFIVGLSTSNQLVAFDSATPGTLQSARFISGLPSNEQIIGIDFRPSTGQLFGLGSLNRLYTLNLDTGAATPVGSGFTPLLNGVNYGFDFNPVVDLIRVTSDLGQNLRLNPNTGGLTAQDTNLAFAAGDVNANQSPRLAGSAYTNNFPGATITTLYGIDVGRDALVTQNPPNNGTLNTVGGLGL